MNDRLKQFLDKNSSVPTIGGPSVADAMKGSPTPILNTGTKTKKSETYEKLRNRTANEVIATYIIGLTNKFFQFYKVHKLDIDKCAEEINRLDKQYEAWLQKNKAIYDVDVCRDFFRKRMVENFDTSMLELQLKKAFPSKKSADYIEHPLEGEDGNPD